MHAAISTSDFVFIYTSLGGAFIFVGTVILLALRTKAYLDKQFRDHRRFIYEQFKRRDRAIMRLEYWAIKGGGTPYQPGVDPLMAMYVSNGTEEHNGEDETA